MLGYLHHNSVVILDFHVVQTQHFVLVKGAVAQFASCGAVLGRQVGVLQERPGERVDKNEGEIPLTVSHLH
jgi:hypothetical protein